jgi:hypothetical protein
MTANRRRALWVALAAGGLLASATALAIGIGSVLDRPATLMSPADYLAAKKAIGVDSNMALDKCLTLEGVTFSVCIAQVRAEDRMRRALLETRYLGTVEAAESFRQVMADAAYDVATAKCDGRESRSRIECLKAASDQRMKLASQS